MSDGWPSLVTLDAALLSLLFWGRDTPSALRATQLTPHSMWPQWQGQQQSERWAVAGYTAVRYLVTQVTLILRGRLTRSSLSLARGQGATFGLPHSCARPELPWEWHVQDCGPQSHLFLVSSQLKALSRSQAVFLEPELTEPHLNWTSHYPISQTEKGSCVTRASSARERGINPQTRQSKLNSWVRGSEQREGEGPAPRSQALQMTIRKLIISFRN